MTTMNLDALNFTSNEVKSFLDANSSLNVSFRDHFGLFEEYVSWVKAGKKCTTIRYRQGMVDFPKYFVLRIVSTNAKTRKEGSFVGLALIQQITIKPFGELTIEDAINDGFQSIADLRQALFFIYSKIEENEMVTIYKFRFLKIRPKKRGPSKHCYLRELAYIH